MPYRFGSLVLPLVSGDVSVFTNEQWFRLVEARKDFLMRSIDDIGQGTLGNVRHWCDFNGHWMHLRKSADSVRNRENGLTLKTRGVFLFDEATFNGNPEETFRTFLVYGFDEKGRWMVACVSFTAMPDKTVKDKAVSLYFTSPQHLLETWHVAPDQVFTSLSEVVKSHAERRRELYDEAQELWHTISIEDDLLFPQESED